MLALRPPIRLDIRWTDLCFALIRCLVPRPTGDSPPEGLLRPDGRRMGLITLSVRSGLDLFLQTVNLPHGSEVMVSAVTHPEIPAILRHHGLKPIPIDVDPSGPRPKILDLQRSVGSRTRALVIAYLFGTRFPLDDVAALCRKNNLFLIEDCAQAFDGRYYGHPDADISLFSFGPLKNATALGGALLCVRERHVYETMTSLQESYPRQSNLEFAVRAVKYGCLHGISSSTHLYGGLFHLLKRCGFDTQEVLSSRLSALPGAFALHKVRKRPSPPLIALLERRLCGKGFPRLAAKRRVGEWVSGKLSPFRPPASHGLNTTYWIFPIVVENGKDLIAALEAAGFHAVRRPSNLVVVNPPTDRPDLSPRRAQQWLSKAVFIPVYPEMTHKELLKLVETVLGHSEG